MGIRSDQFDHRLEALETRSLLSAALPTDMPRLLTGELPIVTEDFLNPKDVADPVDAGAGDDADVAMSFEKAGNPDFDADYRDWTWELEGTQIDGGQGLYEFPGFGTVDGQMHGLPASASGPRISDRPEVDQTLPPDAAATISDEDLAADMGYGTKAYGPAKFRHSGIEAPKADAVKVDVDAGIDASPALPPATLPALFETAPFEIAAGKKDAAKVSLIASYVDGDLPRSDALVLPTLL